MTSNHSIYHPAIIPISYNLTQLCLFCQTCVSHKSNLSSRICAYYYSLALPDSRISPRNRFQSASIQETPKTRFRICLFYGTWRKLDTLSLIFLYYIILKLNLPSKCICKTTKIRQKQDVIILCSFVAQRHYSIRLGITFATRTSDLELKFRLYCIDCYCVSKEKLTFSDFFLQPFYSFSRCPSLDTKKMKFK